MVILIHELAHCYACIYYGIEISEINLFIFGGVAKFHGHIEENPKQEVIIALVGPLSNFILIVITFFIGTKFNIQNNSIINFFLTINITICLFNLIPILPLDGGRVVRGFMGHYLGVKRATYIVIKFGYCMCVLSFGIGIYLALVYDIGYIFLSLLSVYIFLANKDEKERAGFIFIKDLVLKNKTLFSEGIMEAKYITAMEFIDIKKIFDEFTLEQYYIIVVTDTRGKVIGNLSESEIIDAIIKYNNISLGKLIDIQQSEM